MARHSFWNPNPEPYIPYRNPPLRGEDGPLPVNGGFGAGPIQSSVQSSANQVTSTESRGGGGVIRKGLQSSSAPATTASSGTTAADPGTTAQTTGGQTNGAANNAATLEEKTTVAKFIHEPGETSGFSPDGSMGSTVAPVVLPGFDALYITLSGQATDFPNIQPRSLDYNTWFLESAEKPYLKTATMRYFHWQVFEAGSQIPSHPDCRQEILDNGQIKVICQGPFPLINGHMLRLIVCGVPNMDVIRSAVGNVENPLAAFVDRAWIRGEESLWDLDVCPERRYVDYVFYGTDLQLVFPLELNKLAFLVQFPKDYPENMDTYGAPVPNHLGIHNRTYDSNGLMSRFLEKGRIVQAIQAIPMPTILGQNARLPESTNYLYTSPPSATGGKIIEGMPGNEVCLELENWDSARTGQEIALFELINHRRAQGAECGGKGPFSPAPPIDMEPTLRCAARYHSRDMNDRNFFAHTNPDFQTEGTRIFLAGILPVLPGGESGVLFSQTGENIARGPTNPQAVLQEWLGSEEHCANLMNANFTSVGIGFHPGEASGAYWTTDFGTEW